VKRLHTAVHRAVEASIKVAQRHCLWSSALLHEDGRLKQSQLMPEEWQSGDDSDNECALMDAQLPVMHRVSSAFRTWSKRKVDVERL